MAWIVGSLFALLFLTGVVRLLLFIRGRDEIFPQVERSLGRKRFIALAFFNILCSGFGFVLLVTKAEEPLNILIGVSLVELMAEVGFRKGAIL